MVTEEDIRNIFKEQLSWIQDRDLQDKVVLIWKTAADEGKWNSLDDVPFTLLIENSGKLTDHTIRVTTLAKTIGDKRAEEINTDYLVAGALLHDVGKLVEYDHSNPKIVKSAYGKLWRHPVSGSRLAWQAGLPDEIVHIIYCHSHEGDNIPRQPEAVIVNHSDFIDFHIKKGLLA